MKISYKNKINQTPHTARSHGFMVIEILIATSIIAISILAAMAVSQKSIQVSRQALHTTQAAFLLEEGAEAVRVLRDNNWANISSLSLDTDYYPLFEGGTWILSSTPNTVGLFTRTARISAVNRDDVNKNISEVGTEDPDTKLATINVSWNEGGVATAKSLKFYVMNIF